LNISSVKLVYFSPTKTTQKVLEGVAGGMDTEDVEHINLTPPDAAERVIDDLNDELVILGAPVYGGRLPETTVKRFANLKGNNTPAVVIVLYGNREYEDALLELKDLAVKQGFMPVAGAAFIGEHSFNSPETPLADGRPDSQDLQKAMEFGKAVKQKLKSIEDIDKKSVLNVPGNFPYKERRPHGDECADTIKEKCVACGTCVDVCPTGAVTMEDHVETDSKLCIVCCACVKNCPTGARVMDIPKIKNIMKWLSENYSTPKQPEIFL
jgi:ferredoxin